MKKWICLLLAVCMLGSVSVYAAAPSEKALFDVTSLGIIQGDESGAYQLDKTLTRAEFAEVIVKLMGLSEAAGSISKQTGFLDVKAEDWFAPAVSLVTQMGVMNGFSAVEFAPDAAVTLEQAVKTLVVAMGYGGMANDRGGFPQGHWAVAVTIGLTKDMKPGEAFTRGDLVTMLYNALDIAMLTQTASGGGVSYETAEGETFRNRLMNESAQDEKVKGRGIVTANYITWLSVPSANIKSDQVEIDGYRYQAGATNASDLLGMEVDYYAQKNQDGSYTLLSVKPTSRNDEVAIASKDIHSASLNMVKYEDEDQNEQTYSIDPQPKIVRNGALVKSFDDSTVKCANGTMRLLDNSGDGLADVIFIEELVSVRVDEVKEDVIYLASGYSINGTRFLEIRESDRNVKYLVYDTQGNEITAEQIHKDDIISVLVDDYKSIYKLIVSSQSVTGTVNEISEDEIKIDGDVYEMEPGRTVSFSAGDEITAYLDFRGYIAGAEIAEGSARYGYIAAISNEGGISDVEVRMLTGKTVVNEIEKNEQDQDDKNEIPVLVCQNETVEVLKVADTVKLDGKSVSGTELKDRLAVRAVKYSLDRDGRVKTLKSAELAGGEVGTKLKFNAHDKTFGGISNVTPFAVGENTKAICVPDKSGATRDDYLMQVRLDNRDSDRRYQAQGYEFDRETKKVKLMVITEAMNADDVGNINIDTSKIGMVTKSSLAVDEDGDEIYKISILSDGDTVEYDTVQLGPDNAQIAALRKGDLIYFVKSGEGRLENVRIIYSFSQGVGTFYDYVGRDNEQICGPIDDLEFDEVDNSKNRLATRITVGTTSGSLPVLVPQRNCPPVFIYEQDQQRIRVGSVKDANPASDMIFMIMPYDSVKACVIVK